MLVPYPPSSLWMLAGLILLGWVLIRRTIRMRKRANADTRAANEALRMIRDHREPSVPLGNAPPEIQRWQVAMYDVQRELTAELDTRIALAQSLIRQMDHRIESLGITPSTPQSPRGAAKSSPMESIRTEIASLAKSGWTAQQISEQLAIPIGDVEWMLGWN